MSKSPTPEDLLKSGSEWGHQAALFMWAQQNEKNYPELRWLFSIPNGGMRDKITAGRMKASGVKSGIPDIFLPIKREPYFGLWIELKVKKNTPSPEQKEWIAHFLSQGYGACVCYGFQEARDTIIKYLEYKNV